jgi:enoyl-CoA hydratase
MSSNQHVEPDSPLLVEHDGSLLIATFNRPHVRNAVNFALARTLAAALDQLDDSAELQVGVLHGAGGTFCSGLDLKAFLAGEPREVEGRGFAGLTEAPPRKPLIAAVEGAALAGGCEIALACDLIVASESARFGLPEVKRGLIAGSGGLLRLPRRIPPQIAMEYALTGEELSASEAHRWGLVNRLCAPGEALATARALGLSIAANAPLSVQFTTELVRGAAMVPEDGAWRRQRELLQRIVASDDAREGADAFLQRRPPRWRGL